MYGSVFYIGEVSEHSREISLWTMEWLEENHLYAGPCVYACTNTELALESLAKPLEEGQPPSLIIIDHSDQIPGIEEFSHKIRSCLPECWIVDLVRKHSHLPLDLTAFVIKKPVRKDDWLDILTHIYLKASTPQWSRTLD